MPSNEHTELLSDLKNHREGVSERCVVFCRRSEASASPLMDHMDHMYHIGQHHLTYLVVVVVVVVSMEIRTLIAVSGVPAPAPWVEVPRSEIFALPKCRKSPACPNRTRSVPMDRRAP